MAQYSFLISSILILLIDSVYLNLFSGYFANQVKNVQNSSLKLNLTGAALAYLFIIIIFNYFVLGFKMNLSESFLLGLSVYGVYEGTTYAIFKNWSLLSVFIDTLWGGVLFFLTNYIMQLLKKIKL